MVSFFLGFGLSLYYLNQTKLLHGIVGLVLRDRNLLVFMKFLFSLKIEETCTLTTFVEQKLSLRVKKLRNLK